MTSTDFEGHGGNLRDFEEQLGTSRDFEGHKETSRDFEFDHGIEDFEGTRGL